MLLVLAAWIIAVGGESSEKYYIHRGTFSRKRKINKANVIDAEFQEINNAKT